MTHTPKRHTEAHSLRMAERRIKQRAWTGQGLPSSFYPSATLNRQGLPHPRTREIGRNARRG